jgi:hypothetical protein
MDTNTRDLLNHQAGKGDKERSPGWRENYPEIEWGKPTEGFVEVRPGKVRKVYGVDRG